MFKKLSFKNKEEYNADLIDQIDPAQIPKHIAIIMDGNGRWAKKRGLPRMAGHHEGMKTVKKIVRTANTIGVEILTLYAFSTENWKRPKTEVEYLMKLPQEFLNSYLPELKEQNVRVRIIGNKEALPESTLFAVNKAIEDTKENTGLILNFALNYGSRNELIHATKEMIKDHETGKLMIDQIDETTYSNYLMTQGLADPELLIRTSGEMRLSNFLLWQLAYAEFIFVDELWPDFSNDCFLEAILKFQSRGRRFGGI